MLISFVREFVVLFRRRQNSQLSVEEFHAKLQQATNFPLRPFVIPFLKVSVSV